MEWLIAHWAVVTTGLLVADRIAAATPQDFKLIGIPVGKWDDQVVRGIRFVARKIVPLPEK